MTAAVHPQGRRTQPDRSNSETFGAPGFVHLIPLALGGLLLLIVAWNVRQLGPLMAAARARPVSPPQDPLAPAPGPPLEAHLHPQVARWLPQIEAWSQQSGVPAPLIAAVVQIESCGDPLAVSPAGALGLFQVMPYHFTEGEDRLDLETNARAGVQYLARAWHLAGGDPALTLAGYNGGHSQIDRPPSAWPIETQHYVRWGTGLLADIQNGRTSNPTLEAWLEAGGVRLCEQKVSGSPNSLATHHDGP